MGAEPEKDAPLSRQMSGVGTFGKALAIYAHAAGKLKTDEGVAEQEGIGEVKAMGHHWDRNVRCSHPCTHARARPPALRRPPPLAAALRPWLAHLCARAYTGAQ